jgi:hypothetical protein
MLAEAAVVGATKLPCRFAYCGCQAESMRETANPQFSANPLGQRKDGAAAPLSSSKSSGFRGLQIRALQ